MKVKQKYLCTVALGWWSMARWINVLLISSTSWGVDWILTLNMMFFITFRCPLEHEYEYIDDEDNACVVYRHSVSR